MEFGKIVNFRTCESMKTPTKIANDFLSMTLYVLNDYSFEKIALNQAYGHL